MPKPALRILKYQLNISNDTFKDNIPFKLIRNTEKEDYAFITPTTSVWQTSVQR